jgi:hypothetical protein
MLQDTQAKDRLLQLLVKLMHRTEQTRHRAGADASPTPIIYTGVELYEHRLALYTLQEI